MPGRRDGRGGGRPAFRAALGHGAALRILLHRYTQVMLARTAQGAVCNRLHSMYRRCARWWLETHDRGQGDDWPLTQGFLASRLAVRRATVSAAAGMLQRAGLIRHHGGRITILHRAGLEAATCECYRAIRDVAGDLLALPSRPRLESARAARPAVDFRAGARTGVPDD